MSLKIQGNFSTNCYTHNLQNNQQKQASFKGYINGHYHDDDIITDARKLLNTYGQNWKESSYCKNLNRNMAERYLAPTDSNKINGLIGVLRGASAYLTGGASELYFAGSSALDARRDKKTYEKLCACINDINIVAQKEAVARAQREARELAIYVKMQEAVKKGFLDQLQMERQAKPAIIPNIIGIETDDFKKADDLINYAKAESGCNFKLVQAADEKTMFDNLSDTLENAKSLFTKEGQRTLIQVDNFEKIANENISAPRMGALKAVTSELAQQFKSTIIFKTKDMSQIASDIRQGHRIDLKIIAKNIIDALG